VRIERIELRLLHLPLVRYFETSFGRTVDRQFILVTVEDSGAVGIGECVADANPYYSAETTSTAWHIIAEFIAPIVLGRQFDHPREVFGARLQRLLHRRVLVLAFGRDVDLSLAIEHEGHRVARA